MRDDGASVQRRRLALGMDRKALAAAAGVDRGTLSRLEDDPTYRQRIKSPTLRAILSTLERVEEENGITELEGSLMTVTLNLPGGGRAIVKGDPDGIGVIMERLMRGEMPTLSQNGDGPRIAEREDQSRT